MAPGRTDSSGRRRWLHPGGRLASRSVLLALGLAACDGEIFTPEAGSEVAPTPPGMSATPGIPGTTVTPPAPTPDPPVNGVAAPRYSCDPTASPLVDVPLRRLSHRQLVSSITTAIARLAGSEASAVLAESSVQLAALPADRFVSAANKGRDGFERADQVLSQDHADAQYALAVKLGQSLTASAARRGKVFGSCLSDADTGNDSACLDTFLRTQGSRLLHRPFTAADVTFYRRALRGTPISPESLADVLAVLFASPEAFFVVEGAGTAPATASLDAYELASRLSLALWDELPDDALWAAASSGALLTDTGYRAQVARLLGDGRAKATLRGFFTGWFQLHRTPKLTDSLTYADYKALVGTQALPATVDGVLDDVFGAVDAAVEGRRSLAELLQDRAVYARDAATAGLYGVAPWDGTSAPPQPQGGRAGLFTRLAFLTTGNASSHPILRGVRLRVGMLCDALGEAPPNAAAQAAATPLDGTEGDRAKAAAMTEHGGCAACHRTSINPLGFAFEGFDALGRARTTEKVFSPTTGALVAEQPIDTRSTPYVLSSDSRPTADPVELTARVAESKKFESCMVTQYFRFTFARISEAGSDQCLLSRVEPLARAGASIPEIVEAFVTAPEFKRRIAQEVP